ncbi:MAG: hypothetical protein H0X33_12340 [Taibaiella sp.]|nr:hypothetical protein [Taibaiella sp.]
MLTSLLREQGHEVISWVENNYGEDHNHVTKKVDFENWVNSPEADQSFEFDTKGATQCNLFIYYGPAGKDACAEKGEDLGLMRKMVTVWCERCLDVLKEVESLKDLIPQGNSQNQEDIV